MRLISYSLKCWNNSVKISNYLSNFWTNISGIKQTVYRAKKFGIQSLFVSIWFKIDQIVPAWLNIAVTYSWPKITSPNPATGTRTFKIAKSLLRLYIMLRDVMLRVIMLSVEIRLTMMCVIMPKVAALIVMASFLFIFYYYFFDMAWFRQTPLLRFRVQFKLDKIDWKARRVVIKAKDPLFVLTLMLSTGKIMSLGPLL